MTLAKNNIEYIFDLKAGENFFNGKERALLIKVKDWQTGLH